MPDSNSHSPAQRFVQLLEGQLEQYRRVLDLSERQNESIAAGDTDALMQILSEKQRVIQMVEGAAVQTAPLKQAWEDGTLDVTEAQRKRVEEAVEALRGILARIVELEDQGQKALANAKDDTGGRIAKVQKGKMLNKAYGGGKKQPPSAHFRDTNG